MKLTLNGQTFTGEKFEVVNQVLHVDGYAVMDLKPKTEEISINGDGTLVVDNTVVIYGKFTGNINAKKVIINGDLDGTITAEKIIDNR